MGKMSCSAITILCMALILISCQTGTDISVRNDDGSPIWSTEIPHDSRLLYGVGSAKLSNEKNSRDASYATAVSDLARKISVRIDEATSQYSSEAGKTVTDAYENIRVMAVSVTMKGVSAVERWTAGDGTVWTLVSFPVKELPSLYADAANDYIRQQEEKKTDVISRLADLLEELGESDDPEVVSLRTVAEEKAMTVARDTDLITGSIKVSEIESALMEGLIRDGYETETEADAI